MGGHDHDRGGRSGRQGRIKREKFEGYGLSGVDQIDGIKASREGERICQLRKATCHHSAGINEPQSIARLGLIPLTNQAQRAVQGSVAGYVDNVELAGTEPATTAAKNLREKIAGAVKEAKGD